MLLPMEMDHYRFEDHVCPELTNDLPSMESSPTSTPIATNILRFHACGRHGVMPCAKAPSLRIDVFVQSVFRIRALATCTNALSSLYAMTNC
jgi:hypothetical protein